MSYTYSLERGEVSSAESFSDIPQFVLSRLNLTADESCSKDSATEFCQNSQSGTTSKPLTESLGAEKLTLSAEGFLAKTSAQPGEARELKASEAGFGERWRESLAKYDPGLRLWRTPQCSLLEGLDVFSETWPKWGMMRNGACWELMTRVRPTEENESGFWPTPTCMAGAMYLESNAHKRNSMSLASAVHYWITPMARDYKGHTNNPKARGYGGTLPDQVREMEEANREKFWPTPQASDNRNRGGAGSRAIQRRKEKGKQISLSQTVSGTSGALNPPWVEWLMGWPIGWTDLRPLEMDKFHSAPPSLGKPFQAWLDTNTKALETCFQYDI